jgi:two-component system response regulator (stage 0 sporulation protein F)
MSKHILIIDDDEAVRKSFALALEDSGFEVDTAESAEKGLQMKKNAEYDLIFLDLKMLGMSGVQILREMRKTDKKVPIYIVTAFYKQFFDELRIAQKEGLGFELLKKPVNTEEIVLLTESIVGQPQETKEAGHV